MRFSIIYRARMTVSLVGKEVADALHAIWSSYRDSVESGEFDFRSDKIISVSHDIVPAVPVAIVTFNIRYRRSIEAASFAEAVAEFVALGQFEKAVPLNFDPAAITVEIEADPVPEGETS